MSTMDTNFALDMEREERRVAGCPWRRYFARQFDFALYGLLWSLVSQWGLRLNIGGSYVMLNVLSTMVGAVLMVVIEPFLLHFWGTTPGKWLFGMEIRTPNGEKLAIRTGFYRTWQVFTGGMGWDLPIWSWYRLYKSYQASTAGELPWDIDNGCHIVVHERKTKWYRVLMFLFAWLLVLAAETDADGYVTAVELHIDTDDVVNGTGTDVKEMLYYGYALPHEKKTMLAMTDEMLQNTEDFTATLGSLTITQKVTFENCTVIGEGENRIYWPEEGKTGHYTMDLRIAEN